MAPGRSLHSVTQECSPAVGDSLGINFRRLAGGTVGTFWTAKMMDVRHRKPGPRERTLAVADAGRAAGGDGVWLWGGRGRLGRPGHEEDGVRGKSGEASFPRSIHR
jgi:hypothetical protein